MQSNRTNKDLDTERIFFGSTFFVATSAALRCPPPQEIGDIREIRRRVPLHARRPKDTNPRDPQTCTGSGPISDHRVFFGKTSIVARLSSGAGLCNLVARVHTGFKHLTNCQRSGVAGWKLASSFSTEGTRCCMSPKPGVYARRGELSESGNAASTLPDEIRQGFRNQPGRREYLFSSAFWPRPGHLSVCTQAA